MKSECCGAEVYLSNLFNRCFRCGKDMRVTKTDTLFSFKQKKGKVILATIHNRTSIPGADKLLFAVGKPKGSTYFRYFEHDPGLAPSRELVTFTKDFNRRHGHKEGWFERYTEKLLGEWSEREDSIKSFIRLVKWLNQGINVGIACYCSPHKRPVCHLSVLRGLLEDMGYEVEEAEPIPY